MSSRAKARLIIFSAPSGAGKSSLIQEVISQSSGNIQLSISATTRPPRTGEEHGRDYFFISDEEFNELKKQNSFVEHANVYGYQYGTLRSFVDEKIENNINVILDIDVQGFDLIRNSIKDGISIFIIPPSISELEKRLSNLSINISRLRGESDMKTPIYEESLMQKYPILIEESKKLYEVRTKKYKASIFEQKSILKNETDNLKLLEEQIEISKSLLEEQLTNRLAHLNLLKEKNQIISKIESADSKIKNIKETYFTEVRTTLLEEISEYEELVERKSSLQDSLNRTNVKSPENGIIKQRFVDTIGGVIQAGEPLFDIVPINDKLIVQAKLSVDQIGYIQKGQKMQKRLLIVYVRNIINY